jgi:hypothetical protein
VLAAICWFVGLFAYESIIVVPAIVALLEWIKFRDLGRCLRSAAAWVTVGLLWIAMRYVMVGGLLPPYSNGATAADPVALRFVKVLGRCFLPPEENAKLMVGLFAGVVVVVGMVHVSVWRRARTGERRGWPLLALEVGFLLALLPAIVFGVSTRTTEGDRLLYFPSCMLSLLAAAVLMLLLPGRRWRLVLCGAYAVASVVFIAGNNRRWVFASRTAEAALNIVRHAPGKVVLVNVPDEWEGAYIFRNNFKEALVVNGIDTNRVRVSHVLTRLEYLRADGRIEPVFQDSLLFIYPATWFSLPGKGESTYYWDKYEWKPLILG